MTMGRQWLCSLCTMAAFVSTPVEAGADPVRHQVLDPNRLSAFRQALERDEFVVTDGTAVPWSWGQRYCDGESPSAFGGSNEAYLMVLVPRAVQEQEQGLGAAFRLASGEAIVLIGLTPPPSKYFSYTPYVAKKTYPDGTMTDVLATLGDSVNNATVHTNGATPFDAPVALVFTPDQDTDARVRSAMRRAGYPAAILNTLVLPASMLRLGYDDASDQLQIVLRNAIWERQEEGDAYIMNAPLRVFRVTPRDGAVPRPFPEPSPLRVRGTGRSEVHLLNALDRLRQGIIDANPGLQHADVKPNPECYEGYDLVQRRVVMCGDSRDAFYVLSGNLAGHSGSTDLALAEDEFLIIYGVNHVAAGKATYMNVNVYAGYAEQVGVGSVDDRRFLGTARPYLDEPAADVMYTYKIARSCGEHEPRCLSLSSPCPARLALESSPLLGIFTRIYLEPSTQVGPAMSEILYDRVIKFSPP